MQPLAPACSLCYTPRPSAQPAAPSSPDDRFLQAVSSVTHGQLVDGELDLTGVSLSLGQLQQLCAALVTGATGVRRICLAHNSLTREIWGLGDALSGLGSLQELDLSYNAIGGDGVRAICANEARFPELQSLFLGHNGITDSVGVVTILRNTPRLTMLQLDGNPIGDAGVEAIAQELPTLCLQSLGLCAVGLVTETGCMALVQAIMIKRSLTHLDVTGNVLSGDAKLRLEGCRRQEQPKSPGAGEGASKDGAAAVGFLTDLRL